jgi:hypothetical protein
MTPIGYVDEVNGAESDLVEGYPLARFELLELARHWAREQLEIRIFWFLHAQTSSSESRTLAYAQRRLNRIEELLGGDEVRRVIDEVEGEARRRIGDRYWDVFKSGDSKARKEVQDEVQQQLDARMAARSDGERRESA